MAYYGIFLTVNICVNLGIVRCPGKLDFFECYFGIKFPGTITFTSLLGADQGLMVPASGYSAVHISWKGDMYADGSWVRGVY